MASWAEKSALARHREIQTILVGASSKTVRPALPSIAVTLLKNSSGVLCMNSRSSVGLTPRMARQVGQIGLQREFRGRTKRTSMPTHLFRPSTVKLLENIIDRRAGQPPGPEPWKRDHVQQSRAACNTTDPAWTCNCFLRTCPSMAETFLSKLA